MTDGTVVHGPANRNVLLLFNALNLSFQPGM
jgi:hypothetical protein